MAIGRCPLWVKSRHPTPSSQCLQSRYQITARPSPLSAFIIGDTHCQAPSQALYGNEPGRRTRRSKEGKRHAADCLCIPNRNADLRGYVRDVPRPSRRQQQHKQGPLTLLWSIRITTGTGTLPYRSRALTGIALIGGRKASIIGLPLAWNAGGIGVVRRRTIRVLCRARRRRCGSRPISPSCRRSCGSRNQISGFEDLITD